MKEKTPDVWVDQKTREAMQQHHNKFMAYLLFGEPFRPVPKTEEEKYRDNLKWAFVTIGEKRLQTMVNNKDMKAYETVGYMLKEPLTEIKYDSFDRWCRLMDM